MIATQDITGNTRGVASDRIADVLRMLSRAPYMGLEELAACAGRGNTSTRKHVTRAEEAGLVSHVLHGLQGRKGRRRYMLTGEGVQTLAGVERLRVADLMDRPGATGRSLASCHRRIDVLEGVYRTAATIAACSEEPELRVHVPRDGPLDGLVRVPEDRRSFGVMVKRPALDDGYFGLKAWRYGAQVENRPSALLVVAPTYLAEHGVQRLVDRNWSGDYWITSLEDLGDPGLRAWRKPNCRDDEEEFWTMREIVESVPADRSGDDVPVDEPYRRAALPRRGWSPGRALTPAESRTLYAVADWPLAGDGVICALAEVTLSTLPVVMRRLRAHGLICRVETRQGERRWALADAGLRRICASVRSASGRSLDFWSPERRDDGTFLGSKLRKLDRELLHTDVVHDLVARISEEAASAVDVAEFRVLPAHLTELRPVMPDARIDLESASGARHVLLLEAERGMPSRAEMRARLTNYERAFETEWFREAFPVRPRIAVVLEDPGAESNFSRAQVEAGRRQLPIVLTNLRDLAAGGGFLQAVWRRPGEYEKRSRFWELE